MSEVNQREEWEEWELAGPKLKVQLKNNPLNLKPSRLCTTSYTGRRAVQKNKKSENQRDGTKDGGAIRATVSTKSCNLLSKEACPSCVAQIGSQFV